MVLQALLGNISAGLLLCSTFLVVLCFRDIRKDRRVLFVVYGLLLLRHATALVNAYMFEVKGGGPDAATFHCDAVEWAVSGQWHLIVSAEFYIQSLGTIYRFLGASHLLGEELSILAFAVSCGILIKVLRLLEGGRYCITVLLLYGLLPSGIIFTSLTLRESFEILFFMLAVYWGVRGRIHRNAICLILGIVSSLAMGLFHKGLVGYAVFLTGLLVLWPFRSDRSAGQRGLRKWGTVVRIAVVAVVAMGAFIVLRSGVISGAAEMEDFFVAGKPVDVLRSFRGLGETVSARTTYVIQLDNPSSLALCVALVQMFLWYMLLPFPWNISTTLDLYAFLEVVLRIGLIVLALITWRSSSGRRRSVTGMLVCIYFSMAVLWSLGTVNYGTAIRHHFTNYWILVVLGVIGFDHVLRMFSRRRGEVRDDTMAVSQDECVEGEELAT